MSKGTHIFPMRVYYEDTDAGGVVYYANYLKFAERARSEFLRSIGTGNRQLKDLPLCLSLSLVVGGISVYY